MPCSSRQNAAIRLSARRLKFDPREIRRMLDPKHRTKLSRIQKVLEALGKRLVLALDDAA